MENVSLTNDQDVARAKILDWYTTYKTTKKQLFVLSGYAGTGKTFLIDYIIEELELEDEEVAFGTPTGKAASVLIQRGRKASTIHRLIYTPIEEEYNTKVNGEIVKSKKVSFVKIDDVLNYKLIVIDEISMVDNKMMKDLLSFGIPVLATGDQGQLPPINGDNDFINEPDAELEEIVRQSLDNPIVKLATMARHGEDIPYGDYGTVLVMNRNMLTPPQMQNLLLKANQVLCGTNKTRKYWNDEIRKYKGIDIIEHPLPIEGDKVICTVNNWTIYLDDEEKFNLVNGTIGNIVKAEQIDMGINLGKLSFEPDFLKGSTTDDILFDTGIFIKKKWSYDMHQRAYFMKDGTFKLKKWLSKKTEKESMDEFRKRVMEYIRTEKGSLLDKQINRLEFGYVVSCHKAMGSEWDKVVIFDESYIFGENASNWLYTSITRSKKKLVIIR